MLSDRREFGSGEVDVDVELGGAEQAGRERAHELVGAGAPGVRHAVEGAGAEGQAAYVPAFEVRFVEILKEDVAAVGLGGLFKPGRRNRLPHLLPAEDRFGFPVLRGRLDGAQYELRAFEDASEGIIVGGRDGIEFVIVAAGAGDREAEEGFPEDVDPAVHFLSPHFAQVGRSVALLA